MATKKAQKKKIEHKKVAKPAKTAKLSKIAKTEKKAIAKKATPKNKKLKEKNKNQKFYDQLKLNESYVSLILGALVVLFISGLVMFYLVQTRDSVNSQRVLNSVVTPTPSPEKDTYVMQEGESLWDVSVRFYGDGFSYVKIVEANKNVITNPDYVPPGTEIIIPNL